MQSSKVCVNEAGPGLVTVDFASAANRLLYDDNPYGFAYRKTLEHLGFEQPSTTPLAADMVLEGSVESVREHIPELDRHIGVIARYGAKQDNFLHQTNRNHIGSMLGRLTQETLPQLPENVSLMRAVGVVTEPFADALSDDYTHIYYARPAPWGPAPLVGASDEHGGFIRPFGARDIGGLEIGPSGSAARKSFSFNLALARVSFIKLQLVATANGRTLGAEIRDSMHHMLNQPEIPLIVPQPAGENPEVVRATYPRTDLAKLETLPRTKKAKPSDAMRQALDMYLTHLITTTNMSFKLRMANARYGAVVDPRYLPPIEELRYDET